jgi:hypothetical protein
MPYYEHKTSTKRPFTVWSSHQESKEPLRSKFISVAQQADWCMSPSIKYVKMLQANGISKVSQVRHGVDLDAFRPLAAQKNTSKLTIGAVCRSYASTTRKNEQLLSKIAALDFVDLMITGGKIGEEDMPRFYSECDLIVQTSLIEGGSMAITEGLACGRPILCYAGVGVADEFEHGVIRAVYNDDTDFLGRIRDFWISDKDYYRQPQTQQLLRSQVEQHTWQNFVKGHDDIWQSLV